MNTEVLDQYTPEQLKTIISNIAPHDLLDWAAETKHDLTDPEILRKYRFCVDGLRDFITYNRHSLHDFTYNQILDHHTREEVIDQLMEVIKLDHFGAKAYVEANWDEIEAEVKKDRHDEIVKIATRMKYHGMDIPFIKKYTELSEEEIEALPDDLPPED